MDASEGAGAGTPWRRHAATLLIFAVAFVSLEVFSYTRESATWDEPIHVMDGYLSLARGDFRVDIEHPPLLRMWSALPLLPLSGITAHTDVIDRASPMEWALDTLFYASHQFMYVDNDADLLLYRARFMTVPLAIGLGVLLYAWVNALFGWPAAAASLALYAVEPNIASHGRLVTTDLGVTLAVFGAAYFLWRLTTRWSRWNLAGVAAMAAFAVTAKYSGLLLGSAILVLLAFGVMRRNISWRRAAGVIAVLGFSSVVAVWATYGFRYEPSSTPGWRFDVHSTPAAMDAVPRLANIVEWIDAHRLLPNAYSEGLLLNQMRSQSRMAFLAGDYRKTGWWYYFPVAFALKTPFAVIVLALAGAWWMGRRWHPSIPFILVPIAVYLGVAMTAHINIGVRHILPIYPFVLVVAGGAVHHLLARGRTYVVGGALALAIVEPLAVYPHTLAFFNVLARGASHGAEYLVDSNIDWGQDLKGLQAWMAANHVDLVNLAYFGSADPHYYGINCLFLPGSAGWVSPALVQLPRLPGYVAVSVTMLSGAITDDPLQREFYTRLKKLTPVASIGYSILVYRIDQPWYLDLRPSR